MADQFNLGKVSCKIGLILLPKAISFKLCGQGCFVQHGTVPFLGFGWRYFLRQICLLSRPGRDYLRGFSQRPNVVRRQRPAGSRAPMRRRVRKTSRAMVSLWVGVRMSRKASWRMRSSGCTRGRSTGTSVGKMGSCDPARANWRAVDALVEARQRDGGFGSGPHQSTHADFCDITSH